jgi:hypothetical protein
MKKIIFFLSITLTLSAFAQVPSYVPTNGLIGWWPFNGNANDESGNNLNGNVIGATLTSDRFGNVNSAYNFDFATVGFGTQTDEIYIPYAPILNSTAISISVWVYQRQYVWSGNTNPPMSTIAARVQFGYSNPNGEVWMLNSGTNGINGFSGAPNITLNSWTHIVTTFENGTGNIYINGSLVSSQNNLSPLNINGNSGISIGESNQANGYWWPTDGVIDDFALWNRALTPCEIADLYNAQLGSLNTTSTTSITNCENYTWNGQTYTQSGQYSFETTNAAGCDSTATLNLTITQPTAGSETITECSSFTWGANNQTYTSSGQYTTVLTNAAGCDSTATLNLTITQPTAGSETITECSSFTWGANNQTYTQSGQYTTVFTNAAGCDSTGTLNLTITQPTAGSETITECNSFTWGANNQTYTQSGQYTTVLTNAAGCDSTATLNLTINTVDNGITQVDDFTLQANLTGASYQWLDCKDDLPVSGATNQQFSPASNGAYAVVVTQNGCADTSECLSIVRLSILEQEKTLLVVYPNPATSMITIENPQGISSSYVITDAQGRQVLAGVLQGESTSIDVAHIANGLYTILFAENKLKEIKFIKE